MLARGVLIVAAIVAVLAAEIVLTASPTDRRPAGAGDAVRTPGATAGTRGRAASRAARSQRRCFLRPSACGYPDPTTTGVPRGLALTPVAQAALPSGTSWNARTHELTVTGPGTVVAGLEVHGTVVIRAPHVTVADSRIVAPPAGFGVAIPIDSPADGTRLVRLSIGAEPGQVSTAAVNNRGVSRLTITESDFRGCTECFQNQARRGGTTVIRDSYMRSSDATPTCDADCPHYEVVYSSGNPGPMVLEHNTMLNPVDQTAVVFVDRRRHDDLRITENLIAGGGYTIYAGVDSRRQSVTGNRFSTAFRRVGQDTYTRGPWPIPKVCVPGRAAGCFGTLTFAPRPSQLTWAGNYWDDTLRPVGR